MEAKDTDIFISYRRVDGRDIARNIQLALGKEGFERVFFDYSSMREGMFNEQILTAINHCKDYILVLSPQSMLRCNDPEDWVAKELQTAIEAGCKIIPVQINEPFCAWPQDFPKKFNFIKQIEFLTLRTDEYFPDSIRRLIGWLDSKPSRMQKENDGFSLTVHIDETCDLYLNGNRIRKIKGGKSAVLNDLKRGQTYKLKFISLAQKNSEMEVEYVCPDDNTPAADVIISFIEARKQKQRETEQQRATLIRAKEQAYQRVGNMMQICEYYDKSGQWSDGMVAVSLNGKIGFVDENGFEAVACEYDDVVGFCEGYASVCKYGKWGIIDKMGQVIVPLQSDTPCWFHGDNNFFVVSQNDHFAISTITQGMPNYYPYDNVIILADFDNLFAVKNNGLWSIIDATGGVSPFTLQVKSIMGSMDSRFSFCASWKEVGICPPLAVQQSSTGRWGYLNDNLKLTVPFVDEGSGEETYDSCWKIIKTNGRMGVVNVESGIFIIPAIYENVHRFFYGHSFSFFRISDGGTGNECTKNEQGNITNMNTRTLLGGKQGVVNGFGDIIVPQQYHYIVIFDGDDDNKPFFAAYIFKELKLSWVKSSNNKMYLRPQYDKNLSTIHIYSSDGTIVKKIKILDEPQIRDIIRDFAVR